MMMMIFDRGTRCGCGGCADEWACGRAMDGLRTCGRADVRVRVSYWVFADHVEKSSIL